MVTSDGTHLFVVGLVERVQVFLLTAFLLFLGNLQRSKILLEFAFDNPVLILGVLESNLCFLLVFESACRVRALCLPLDF